MSTGAGAKVWYRRQATYATAGLVSAQAGVTVKGINAAVIPGGTISGRVTESSGRQVQFSCVYALNTRTGLAGGNDTVGFDGRYTIFGLAPRRFVVEAQGFTVRNLPQARDRAPVSLRVRHGDR